MRIRQLKVELGIINEQFAKRQEMAASGMRKFEIDRIMMLERQLTIIERQKKAAEQRREADKDLRKKAAEVRRDFQSGGSDNSAFNTQMAELMMMLRRGMISQSAFQGASTDAAKQSLGIGDTSKKEVQSGIGVRSQESYAFFRDMQKGKNDEERRRADIQKKLVETTNALLEKNYQELQAIAQGLPEFKVEG
jgi:hypothetical protein